MSKSLDIWARELGTKAPGTQRIYRKAFQELLEFYGTDADGLYQLKLDSMKSQDPRDAFEVEGRFKVFAAKKVEAGLATKTILHYKFALRSFFEAQNLPLNLKGRVAPPQEDMGAQIINKKQIKEWFELASNRRTQAILMVGKDSGLRVSDIAALRVGHIPNLKADFNIFDFRTKKTGAVAKACLGPEAMRSIRDYLGWRQGRGETISPKLPLFLDREGNQTDANEVKLIFCRMARKLGVKKLSGHSFRKFQTTMLQAGGFPELWINLVQGRRIQDARSAYTKPTNEQILEAYQKAYSSLAIFEVPPDQTEEVDALKQRVTYLENILEARLKQIEGVREFKRRAKE